MKLIATGMLCLIASAAFAAPPTATSLRTPIKKSKASIELKCGGTTYTLSTGTSAGQCTIWKDPADGRVSDCQDAYGNSVSASCKNGCEGSAGAGHCGTK